MGTKPYNFSFIDDFIAGSSFPYEKSNLEFYQQEGISNIVSITTETPLALNFVPKNSFNHLQLLSNSAPIEPELIERYLDFISRAKNSGERVVVHCQFGQERTGILLAIYLIESKGFSVQDAIDLVRTKRPKSLQMQRSITFLRSYRSTS